MTDQILIIGGGHNGLTCAAYLAKAGKKSRCSRPLMKSAEPHARGRLLMDSECQGWLILHIT